MFVAVDQLNKREIGPLSFHFLVGEMQLVFCPDFLLLVP